MTAYTRGMDVKKHMSAYYIILDKKRERCPITLVGCRGVRRQRPHFSRGQHIEGGAHLLSLAALPSLTLKRAGTHLQLGELGELY